MLENRNLNDDSIFKGKRKQLVALLKSKGILDENVLRAIETVPRHFFIPGKGLEYEQAYADKALPINSKQTISQPYTVAYQTELLEVEKGHKVLEIGTGSGYQAAILASMGVQVFSIERHRPLHHETEQLIEFLDLQDLIQLFYGDGFLGLPDLAPFDKVLITAAAPEIPPLLLEQLKIGGMMVLPLGEGRVQQMIRIIKKDIKNYSTEIFDDFSFVPMLKGVE